MKVASSAALGTLTVTEKDLASDPLLQLVIKLASQLQLTVVKPKKSNGVQLELPSGTILSQRNAIIRCLAGMGLHNALDDVLLGGHSKAVAASPTHAMAMASLTSWMSVADHHRKHADERNALMSQLDAHLETRSFLIPSAVPTVADVDVATVVSTGSLEGLPSFPNVHRWLLAVAAVLKGQGIKALDAVPAVANSHGAPVFFYGDEQGVEMPTKKKAAVPQSKKDAPKQQQAAGKGAAGGNNQKKGQQKKGGEGKPKKQQQQQQQQQASFDVSALDIRVGKLIKVWEHPEAEKLYCEEIDVGEDQPRQIASGLRPYYATAKDLEGRRVLVLCNLKKRNLVGFPSHGMVLCATSNDRKTVETMEPPADAKIGERVVFEGYEGNPEPENKIAKKKIFEAVAPDLKTNGEGICVWKDAVSKTSAGPAKSSNGLANAQVS